MGMSSTAAQHYVEEQLREAASKPTVAEAVRMMRARPGHQPYTGPSSAEDVRAQRAEREAQLDKNLGL